VLLPEPSFWELEAEGVWVPEVSELEPRLEPPSELAKSRWSPTSWLTVRLLLSGLVRELSVSPGVPVAEAVASALVLEEPVGFHCESHGATLRSGADSPGPSGSRVSICCLFGR